MTTQLGAFDTSEVAEVLAEITGGAQTDIQHELTVLLEKGLREFLLGLVNMPNLGNLGAPQVMLRVRTFQTILDDFRSVLSKQYDPILMRIGRTIGFNFAITLLRVLRHAKKVPLKYDALLDFWAKFDSAAQMGEFKFSLRETDVHSAEVDVSVRDLFLTLGYGEDEPLRHCPFIIGYLEAALDTSMFLWTRWIKETPFRDPPILWNVRLSNEDADVVREDHQVVRFKICLENEHWPDLKQTLAHAINLSEKESWSESIIAGRVALERCLVRAAGEDPPELKVSFGRLLEQFERVRLAIDGKTWRKTYNECSRPAHEVGILNEVTVTNVLFNVWRCVKEAEALIVAPELGADIRRNRATYIIP
jgi:hypothetical protein